MNQGGRRSPRFVVPHFQRHILIEESEVTVAVSPDSLGMKTPQAINPACNELRASARQCH
jgi:hypothetical protein